MAILIICSLFCGCSSSTSGGIKIDRGILAAKGIHRKVALTIHPNGVRNAPYTPVATAIDIKSAYDNKNGAPSAGAPKVFFKYFYVNTATGEKMVSALLSA